MLQDSNPEFGGGGGGGGFGGGTTPGEMGGEGGDFMGGTPGENVKEMFEVSAESKAKFAAQQAAVQALWKEEQKFRKDDSGVANIILKFLQNPAHTKFFILLARLVARNVPSNFLLAILALIHKDSKKSTEEDIKTLKTTALELKREEHFRSLPPDIKVHIDIWIDNIYKIGGMNPQKTVKSLINPDDTIEEALFQLSTFILEELLILHHIHHEYQEIRTFIELVFISMINKLKEMSENQKKLSGKTEIPSEGTTQS